MMAPPVSRIPTSPDARVLPAESSREPPQVLVVVSGVATVIALGEVGNTSVKVTPVAFTPSAFVSVSVNNVLSPRPMAPGENSLSIPMRPTANVATLEAVPAAGV